MSEQQHSKHTAAGTQGLASSEQQEELLSGGG